MYFKKIFFRLFFEIEKSFFFVILSPFLYINRLIPKTKRLYFANFRSERIGHFAIGFYTRYAELKSGIFKKKCIYCFNQNISNKFISNQIKKYFYVNRIVKFAIIVSKKMPFLKCLIDKSIESASRDSRGLIQKFEMPEFTQNEIQFCTDWLLKNGWKGKSQKIICLHVRDSAYLKNYKKNNSFTNVDFSYHNYRDSDINDYKDSINWLIRQGCFVIRTGKISNKKADIISDSFIDYPFCDTKSDLLDVWLFANSNLVITTGSGIDEISSAYKVPMILINFMPLGYSPSYSKSLTISKHLYWEENNKHLTFNEYLENSNFLRSDLYKSNRIIIKDLNSEEILKTIKDGWSYFIKNSIIKEQDQKITKLFLQKVRDNPRLNKLHERINKKWIVSSNLFD